MSKLSQWKNRKKSSGIPSLSDVEVKVASLGQERLYFLEKLYGNSRLYQYGHTYRFKEIIDIENLEEKFQSILLRHEILRSNFKDLNGQVVIETQNDFKFKIGRSPIDKAEFFNEQFDLSKGLLIRVHLLDSHTLALSVHHIVADRESLIILNRELFQDTKETLPIQFSDFSTYYNSKVNQEEDLAYWRKKLGGELPILDLPFDFRRSEMPTFEGKTINKTISESTFISIMDLCKSSGTTVYTFFLSLYTILLSKYTNQSDILIGTPISNRDNNEVQHLIGFFNETIVLRNNVNPYRSFIEFLDQVKEGFIEAMTHKNVSFDKIVAEIKPVRVKGANPIFQSMFLFNNHNETFSLDSNNIHEEIEDLGISKFDQTIFAIEKEGQLELKLEYSTELFEDTYAIDFLNHFANLLDKLAKNPELKIGEIEIIEDQNLNSKENYSIERGNVSILDRIDFSSEEIAIACDGIEMTYQELDEKSNVLAAELLNIGIKANDFVGLHTSRSIEMLVGIIGILKAGGAYLPLDPNYPEERLSHMIDDSGTRVILFKETITIDRVKKIDLRKIENNPTSINLPSIKSDDLAYMIYTSGSTGKPKGVPISHSNLLYSTLSRFEFYTEQPSSFLLLSSFSFDSSVAGIFWTLCAGGKLVLPPERIEQDVEFLSEIISNNKVTHTLLLPSLYQVLLEFSDPSKLSTLKNIMVAGEACSQNVVNLHYEKLPGTKLYNEYGPTEATVWCIAHEISSTESEPIPIGKPIPFYQCFVLNKDLNMTVPGGAGELYIAGLGLAQGYWNNEELTALEFIHHQRFGRIYKTGDLVKINREHEILFLGREDNQVKIRGHRVELNEIKNRLLAFPAITEAEVVFKENKLIAFVNGEVDRPLGLPEYMIPSQIVELENLPKLPNGKIDRSKLEIPVKVISPIEEDVPESELELQLMSIWQDVIGNNHIGVNDNFFEIGGDSLLSIQIVAKARNVGIKLLPTQLFEFQSIRSLAKSLKQDSDKNRSDVLVSFNSRGNKTPLFCIHGGGAHVFFYKKFATYFSDDIPIYSFQPKGLDGESEMAINIQEMATLYIEEMKKVQAHGPYQILGTCFSNAVALEMTHQLSQAGETVDHLFIIDSAPVHLFGNQEGKKRQTLKRFVDMALRGDFRRIKAKIKSRFFKSKEWDSNIKDAVEADAILNQTIKNLNKMYADYNWQPYKGRINFIRSSEFHGRKDKTYHLTQWNKLAEGGLDISVVDGHHLTLFKEPEVAGLAQEIETLMTESIHEYA